MSTSRPAILLTGTRGSGKSTVCSALEEVGVGAQLRAVTTRPPRGDDGSSAYQYMSEAEFVALSQLGEFLIETRYGDFRYGFLRRALRSAMAQNRRPIMTVTPTAAAQLLGTTKGEARWLCFFLDAPDDVLDQRLQAAHRPASPSDLAQRVTDRTAYVSGMLRVSSDIDLKSLVAHLCSLIDGQ